MCYPPLLAWWIGTTEILVILLVALLIFGRRLPEVGKSLGQGIVEFKRGLTGLENELKNANDTKTPATNTNANTTQADTNQADSTQSPPTNTEAPAASASSTAPTPHNLTRKSDSDDNSNPNH